MEKELILSMHQKKWDATVRMSGYEVLNYWKNKKVTMVFKQNKVRTVSERVNAYYGIDEDVQKGDIILYKGNYYMVSTKSHEEGNIYCCSVMTKCNAIWNLYGYKVPIIASDISSAGQGGGTYLLLTKGKYYITTGICPVITGKLSVEDRIYDFSGYFRITNKHFLEGVATIFFEREASTLNVYSSSSVKEGLFNSIYRTFDMKDTTTADLRIYVFQKQDNISYYLPNAKIEYSVDNENVATVDENGIITLKSAGTVNVTARATETILTGTGSDLVDGDEVDISQTFKYTIVDSREPSVEPDTPTKEYTCTITNDSVYDPEKVAAAYGEGYSTYMLPDNIVSFYPHLYYNGSEITEGITYNYTLTELVEGVTETSLEDTEGSVYSILVQAHPSEKKDSHGQTVIDNTVGGAKLEVNMTYEGTMYSVSTNLYVGTNIRNDLMKDTV